MKIALLGKQCKIISISKILQWPFLKWNLQGNSLFTYPMQNKQPKVAFDFEPILWNIKTLEPPKPKITKSCKPPIWITNSFRLFSKATKLDIFVKFTYTSQSRYESKNFSSSFQIRTATQKRRSNARSKEEEDLGVCGLHRKYPLGTILHREKPRSWNATAHKR